MISLIILSNDIGNIRKKHKDLVGIKETDIDGLGYLYISMYSAASYGRSIYDIICHAEMNNISLILETNLERIKTLHIFEEDDIPF